MTVKIIILILTTLLLSKVHCDQNQQNLNEPPQMDKIIRLTNHFNSEQSTSTSYNIRELISDKPLIFHLKTQDPDANNKTLRDNMIIANFQGENEIYHQHCQFVSYYNFCFLQPGLLSAEFKLTISCTKLPCNIHWVIIEPKQSTQKKHTLQSVYPINENSRHAVILVNCINPELRTTFGTDIHLYSNSAFTKIIAPKGGPVFFLFSNSHQGHYYITTDNDKSRACSIIQLFEVRDDVNFSNPNQNKRDFVLGSQNNKYQLFNLPDSDFKIQFMVSDLSAQQLTKDNGLKLTLVGYRSDVMTTIKSASFNIEDQKTSFSFSYIFKKITQKYDKIQLWIKGINKVLSLQMTFIAENVHDIELGKKSYFDLNKGEVIQYHLTSLPEGTQFHKMNIFISDQTLFRNNLAECTTYGCLFTVQALETGSGNVYIGIDDIRNTSEIIVEAFHLSITRTIRQGEYFYFSFQMSAKNTYQLLVNSPSVHVYAGSKSKCELIDEVNCYQKAFHSQHHPVYESDKQDILLFKVVGLDNCQFTLTVLDKHNPYVVLNNGIPFTYILSQKQDYLLLFFELQQKEDVSFNLIAPVNQLNLLVVNKEIPDPSDQRIAQLSSDGFITYTKENIQHLRFGIKVVKKPECKGKRLHFTLIASTKQVNLRLQPGLPHYQTLKPQGIRQFVFEFSPENNILVNFYTHNIKQNVDIKLTVNNIDSYSHQDKAMHFTIDREVDVLDIGRISNRLCELAEGENCQVYLRLENTMKKQIDITLTLMMQRQVIELKDGIWQNYGVNIASAQSNFYFWPKHQDQSITIFYQSSLVDIQMLYRLYKFDEQDTNVNQWPFPAYASRQLKPQKMLYRSKNFFRIESEALKTCWPYCVILISIKPDLQSFKSSLRTIVNDYKQGSNKSTVLTHEHFKIMASNNFIEIPEQHRVHIAMAKNQEKKLLVNLKYLMDKQLIHFDQSIITGNIHIKANVYSQTNPQCPNQHQISDFIVDHPVAQIAISDIRKVIAQKKMEKDENLYLCLLAQARSSSKFSIEFNSKVDVIKIIALDSSISQILSPNQIIFYQVDASQQFSLKINRINGQIYLYHKKCILGPQIYTCIDKFKTSNERGDSLKEKINQLTFKPCEKCRLFLKFTSIGESKMNIYTVSKYAEVELIEGTLMSDKLNPHQQNRYILTSYVTAEISIHVNVISGHIKVNLHDFSTLNMTDMSTPDKKNIHMLIQAKLTEQQNFSKYGQSTPFFQNLHVTVESQIAQDKAAYSITYSNKKFLQASLQDGLITEYTMAQKKHAMFFYINPTNQSVYLHLSTVHPSLLRNLNITIFTTDDAKDTKGWLRIDPQTPNFHHKTPNPTMLMLLPPKKFFQININNTNQNSFVLKIGVNNRQIISLPFNHDFPVKLNPAEHISIVLSPISPGYIKLTLSKCDISQPMVSYTFNYKQFQKNDFSVQQQMSDQLIQQILIKVSTPGNLYLKIQSQANLKSLLSIKATFSEQQFQIEHYKTGNNGIIQYQIIDSTNAELTIVGLNCGNNPNCNKYFTFYAISSNNIQKVYSQLVCSSIMFDLEEFQQINTPDIIPIHSSSFKPNNKITFTQTLSGDIVYVGVKAYNQRTGEIVYYRPVEIVTFWGQMNRNSTSSIIIGIIIGIAILIGLYSICCKSKRQGYSPLDTYG